MFIGDQKKNAFGKPCRCQRDTPDFRRFHGVWAAKPMFYWLERNFVVFAVFVLKQKLLWQRTSTVYQKHRFLDPC